MYIKTNCKYLEPNNRCTCTSVKPLWFGLGKRKCIDGANFPCSYRISNKKLAIPPRPTKQ